METQLKYKNSRKVDVLKNEIWKINSNTIEEKWNITKKIKIRAKEVIGAQRKEARKLGMTDKIIKLINESSGVALGGGAVCHAPPSIGRINVFTKCIIFCILYV